MFQSIRKLGWVAATATLMAGFAGSAFAVDDEAESAADKPRVLIAYFSLTGNTKGIAERLQKKLGGVLYRIEPVNAYPEDGQEVRNQAGKEIGEGFKPELKGDLPDLDGIDLVLIGGPVWAGTLAPPLSSFLAKVDLKGKTVAPFCTFGGGQREYFKRFQDAMPEGVTALEGLGLGRADLGKGEEDIDKAVTEWAAKLPVPMPEGAVARRATLDDLLGRRFVLASVDGEDFAVGEPAQPPEIEFGEDLRIAGRVCNRFRGPAELKDGKLVAGNLISTQMMCVNGELMKLEELFHAMLRAGADITVAGDLLFLVQGGHTLVYRQATREE